MRFRPILPTIAAVALVASTAALAIAPVQADDESGTKPAQVTIMGDSHTLLMINDMFPGMYSSGTEGTRIDGRFHVYAINGIKLRQVMRGGGVVKAGVSAVGTTDVTKWRKALRRGPDTIVVNLGTNDGGPRAADIDKFMRIAGKDRRVFWIKPYYTSCPACRELHDYQLDLAAKRHANLTLVTVRDLGLTLGSDGLHAYGASNSRALWNRILETISPRRR